LRIIRVYFEGRWNFVFDFEDGNPPGNSLEIPQHPTLINSLFRLNNPRKPSKALEWRRQVFPK
jgi:hypothetical protein